MTSHQPTAPSLQISKDRVMGYSGTASFDFEIERFKNKKTGELTAYVLPGNEDDYEYQLLTLNVEGRSYFQEGRLSGPPENCYPDEGDTEIMAAVGPDGKDWTAKLTHSEMFTIQDMIEDNLDLDGPDYDDDYEDDYDDRYDE